MKVIIVMLVLWAAFSDTLKAQEVEVRHFIACPNEVHTDPSIETEYYALAADGTCDGNRRMDAISDRHLGIIYGMAKPDLSVNQKIIEPQSLDVIERMKSCMYVTPQGYITEWIVPNGSTCQGRPHSGFRTYTNDSVCIMEPVVCVPIADLKPLGQERVRAAFERSKQGRKVTQSP
jgi:hypothetical protein